MVRKRVLAEAAWVWLALAAFAVVNGAFRRFVLDWMVGPDVANFLATTTLAGAVVLASLLWIGTRTHALLWRESLIVGLLWAGGTIVFDLGLARLTSDGSWSGWLAGYDPARGGLLALVLIAEVASPPVVGRLLRNKPRMKQAH